MGAAWELWLKEYDGQIVRQVSRYQGFTFTKRVNLSGAWALRFGKDATETEAAFIDRCDEWAYDGQIEMWYTDTAMGLACYKEYEGLIRHKQWSVTDGGDLLFEVGGRGYNDLLHRRIILGGAGTFEASKSGWAETIMKEWVREQASLQAGPARYIPRFAVEHDSGRGNQVSMARAYRNLLETLGEVAAIGGGDFAVVGSGVGAWEFCWRDRIDVSSAVRFELAFGNMAVPLLNRGRHDDVNWVTVAGQGEGLARMVYGQSRAMPFGSTGRDRIETFADGRNDATLLGLQGIAAEKLEETKPQDKLSFRVLETPATVYGRDYALGNIVGTAFLDYSALKQIAAVTVTASADQKRTVEMETVDV